MTTNSQHWLLHPLGAVTAVSMHSRISRTPMSWFVNFLLLRRDDARERKSFILHLPLRYSGAIPKLSDTRPAGANPLHRSRLPFYRRIRFVGTSPLGSPASFDNPSVG